MKDLIRSPLQFIRPMTDPEWKDLVARAGHRERQRVKRRQPHTKAPVLELPSRRRGDQLTRSASSASL